jgi:hypothetical protein
MQDTIAVLQLCVRRITNLDQLVTILSQRLLHYVHITQIMHSHPKTTALPHKPELSNVSGLSGKAGGLPFLGYIDTRITTRRELGVYYPLHR